MLSIWKSWFYKKKILVEINWTFFHKEVACFPQKNECAKFIFFIQKIHHVYCYKSILMKEKSVKFSKYVKNSLIKYFSKCDGPCIHLFYATPVWKIDWTLLEFLVDLSRFEPGTLYVLCGRVIHWSTETKEILSKNLTYATKQY